MAVTDTVPPQRSSLTASPDNDTDRTDGSAPDGSKLNDKPNNSPTVASYDAASPVTATGTAASMSVTTVTVKLPAVRAL